MDLDGKTILITGGARMIGSATVDLLLRDHPRTRIVILDNLSRGTTANIESALKHPGVRFVLEDISDAATVASACRNVDAVIHLAAQRITACAADPRRAMEVMCDGLQRRRRCTPGWRAQDRRRVVGLDLWLG